MAKKKKQITDENAGAVVVVPDDEIEIVDTRRKAKCWTCTLNNPEYTDDEFDAYLKSIEQLQHFTFQRECGENGTEHFQYFIVFEIAKHFTTVKKYFPRAHLEISKGTKAENVAYCSKPETRVAGAKVYQYGTLVEERTRTDIANILAMIDSGLTILEIKKQYRPQFLMFRKKFETERNDYLKEKFGYIYRDLTVAYIHGTTRVGKSKALAEKYGYHNFFRVTSYDQRAFDNYDGQDIIVFEEFRSSFKISDVLNFLDGHPCQLPCRYEDKTAAYSQVIITTNIPLADQYPNVKENERKTWDAFIARIGNVYDFDNPREIEMFMQNEPNPYDPNAMRVLTPEEAANLPFD